MFNSLFICSIHYLYVEFNIYIKFALIFLHHNIPFFFSDTMLPSSHAAKSLVQLSGFAAVLLLLAAALCDARLQESESLLEDQRSLQGEQDNSIPLADKRAPSGFMGMRGEPESRRGQK